MSTPLSLIFERWTQTIGFDASGSSFKQRCELYCIDEQDELRIQELELKHGQSIISLIKGDLQQSITELGKVYGFSSKERAKWSQFFLGSKIVYESICPLCKNTHIHYSKTNASTVCDICKSPRCSNCNKNYSLDNEMNFWIQEKCCSPECVKKVKQRENRKIFLKKIFGYLHFKKVSI